MAIGPLVWRTLADYLDKVMALDLPEINVAEKKIAFYTAMIDSARKDPMKPEESHLEFVKFCEDMLAEHTAVYQELVNEHV